MRRLTRCLLIPLSATLLLAACSAPSAHDDLAPADAVPDIVHQQDHRVQEAYRFALANPDALKTIPCYCGCNAIGHKNNLECYLKPESTDAAPAFDNHALGCGVCVDITHDVMEMLDSTDNASAIRAFIDSRYSDVGPGTDTPHPGEHGS